MKEETKKKLCKISKIVGFAITFGFAVFGVLCAAMLIGNGSKKDDIKTLDSSLVQNEVRSERNSKPRQAPDFSKSYNLLDDALSYDGGIISTSGNVISRSNGMCKVLQVSGGYYYISSPDINWTYAVTSGNSLYATSVSGLIDLARLGDFTLTEEQKAQFGFVGVGDLGRAYFYLQPCYLCVSANEGSFPGLYLVDTLDLPVGSSISFPESFSPLGLFGDSVTNNGGYVYLPNAEGNELDIEITGLIFKYGGVVYDGIHIECVRALSMGYINDDGQLVKQGGANDYMWALSWIKFYQRYKGQSPQDGIVVVMAELKSVSDNANDMPVAFTGRTQWVNRSDRTIQIIDDLGTTTGRYDGRYSDMTDKELMEWVSSSFSVGNSLGVMGNNSVFDIFTNAFESVLPILSIAILPNITLGMLLFIPLIGAIIVIIIRVVKK